VQKSLPIVMWSHVRHGKRGQVGRNHRQKIGQQTNQAINDDVVLKKKTLQFHEDIIRLNAEFDNILNKTGSQQDLTRKKASALRLCRFFSGQPSASACFTLKSSKLGIHPLTLNPNFL
jgi:hypothetical protein